MTGRRVFVYVQHLLGIGHQIRAAAIIRALQWHGLDVTCVSGGETGEIADLGNARRVQLPPVRAADASFARLIDADGRDIDDGWRDRRRRALLQAFADERPDFILVETFPFGRWQFRFELLPMLEAARDAKVRAAVSVRDILVPKHDANRLNAVVGTIRRYFEAVLVHGDPTLVPFDATFAAADRIRDRIRYTGYVAPPRPERTLSERDRSAVVVAAGGGAVGGRLLRTALEARSLSRLGEAPWRLVTGPNLPAAEREALSPPPGVTIDTLRTDYRELLAGADVSVSQAGYNTVMDILVTGVRAVLVPFSERKETEQGLRAQLLADHGRVRTLAEDALTAAGLAAEIDAAAAMPAPAPTTVNLDGAGGTARTIVELMDAPRG